MLGMMNRRICFGNRPRITSITLYPKDLNVMHGYVEKRGLGCMTQTTKERTLVDFFVRSIMKYEGGKTVSHILKHLTCASSMKDLHHGISSEGSLNTSSKAVVGRDYAGRDLASIVDFCRYSMGIYDFQLMKHKLEKPCCTHEEVKVVHKYLRMQYQLDTSVDKS